MVISWMNGILSSGWRFIDLYRMNQQIRQSEPPGLNDQHPEQLAFEFIPFMFKKQQMQPGMNHQKDLKSPDKTSRV